MRDISANRFVTLWVKKTCGSDMTRKGYMGAINRFFKDMAVEPDELVEEWKKVKYDSRLREQFLDEWTEKIEGYIYSEKFKDWTIGSRMQYLAVIVSFFKNCCARGGIPVEPKREKHVFTKYHNRDITREEIKRILEQSSKRDKAFFLILAESGLRPHTLVQLRYKHIKKDFEAKLIPMMIDLPSELLKDRVEHRWTFMGKDGFKTLRDYLKPRLLSIKNDDLIFLPRRSDYSTVSRDSFSGIFSKLVLKLGIAESTGHRKPKQIRLYCLRKYFMNNVRYEGFDHTFKEFWMGHKTTQTHYVSRNIERHREEYAKAYSNLRIYEKTPIEMKALTQELEKTKEELKALRKQVKYFSSTEYVDKRFKELMAEAMEKLRKENPQWNE